MIKLSTHHGYTLASAIRTFASTISKAVVASQMDEENDGNINVDEEDGGGVDVDKEDDGDSII